VLIGGSRFATHENLETAINRSALAGTGEGTRYGTGTLIHPDVSAMYSGNRLHLYEKTYGHIPTLSVSTATSGNTFATAETQHCCFISSEVNANTGVPILAIENAAVPYGRQVEIWGGDSAIAPIIAGRNVPVYRAATCGGAATSTRATLPGWLDWSSTLPSSSADYGTLVTRKAAAGNYDANSWMENPTLRVLNNRTATAKWSSINNDILHRVMAQANLTATDNATPKDLFSYSVPANTLANSTGESIELVASGATGANADNKTWTVYFGSETLATFGPFAAEAEDWEIVARIHKNDGNRVCVKMSGGTTIGIKVTNKTTLGSVNLGAANTLRIEATSGTATAANITLHAAKLTWSRAVYRPG
jgi:hypothetical protein